MKLKTVLLTSLLILAGISTSFGQNATEKAITKTLDSFKEAIVNNNSEAASALLSESVKILEGGNIESKEQYLSHHFHSDGKFLSAMNREIESREVRVKGNTAWVSTRTHMTGTYSDRELDLSSLELAVLSKQNRNWKIEALHWSSSSN